MTKQSMRKSTDGSTLVTSDNYYIKVTDPVARQYCGSKCILINKGAGCSYEGILREKYLDGKSFVTHFAPFPTFNPDEDKENTSHKEEWKGRQHHLNRVGEALGYGPGPHTERGLCGLINTSVLIRKPLTLNLVEENRDGTTCEIAVSTGTSDDETIKRVEHLLGPETMAQIEKQLKPVTELVEVLRGMSTDRKASLEGKGRRRFFNW